jgi:hypothetical protein
MHGKVEAGGSWKAEAGGSWKAGVENKSKVGAGRRLKGRKELVIKRKPLWYHTKHVRIGTLPKWGYSCHRRFIVK